MSASITTMKDPEGNVLYPKTKTDAIYDGSSNRLDQTLTSIQNNLKTYELSFDNYVTLDTEKVIKAGNASICSIGKMIIMQIDVTTKTNISGSVIIGSTTLKPKKTIFPVAIKWTTSREYNACEINNSTGNITIFDTVANNEYTILATYAIP